MKLTVERKALVKALKLCGAVVSRRALRPILCNVRMSVDGDVLTLAGTDLETAIETTVGVTGGENGVEIVPMERFASFVGKSTAPIVEVTSAERKITLKAGGASVVLHGEDPAEFPVMVFDPVQGGTFSVKADALRSALERTLFAAARERSRFAFNGVRLQAEGAGVRLVATDGKRMASVVVGVRGDATGIGHIGPTAGLTAWVKALGKDPCFVDMGYDAKALFLKTCETRIATRLVEGAFPKYDSVVPSEKALTGTLTMSRAAFTEAVATAKTMTNSEARSVRFAFAEGVLTLTAKAMDLGETSVTVAAKLKGAVPDKFAFDPDFLLEGLDAIEAETIGFRLSGVDTTALLSGDPGYLYCVMPMTVRS